MASNIRHFPKFSVVQGDVEVKVDLSNFEKRYKEAQFWLDSQIMNDMKPYMPQQTNALINLTVAQSAALAGTGTVIAAAGPYGRFQYEGKVMVDPVTNSPLARKDATKVVTEKDLKYSNPKATPQWFDTAKKNHGKAWVEGVKKRAGGG